MLPGIPVLLYSGESPRRNYPANRYPFRASSHYLYFGGPSLERAALVMINGEAEFFYDFGDLDDQVWHGAGPDAATLKERYDLQRVRPFGELGDHLETFGREEVLTLPLGQETSDRFLAEQLGRRPDPNGDFDSDLAQAVIECRLRQDSEAIEKLREAAQLTVKAHYQAPKAAGHGVRETAVLSAMMEVVIREGGGCSFQPIISRCGEILHNPHYSGTLQKGDLLLVDFGAETREGWAGDVTRVWPVGGKFSPTQKAIYEVVLAAQEEAIASCAAEVEFADLHQRASLKIAEGLVEVGILKGKPDQLVERGAHALFFPHGLGHLVGLDVHDMEDLGDAAGYEEGRERRSQFGWNFLRLDRPLEAGMLITVEPGFYNIKALQQQKRSEFEDCVDWEKLEQFEDVRGIRIEDEVLITEDGHEVLTADLAKSVSDVEGL